MDDPNVTIEPGMPDFAERPVERDVIERIRNAGLDASRDFRYPVRRVIKVYTDEGRQQLKSVIPGTAYLPLTYFMCFCQPFDEGTQWEEKYADITAARMMQAASEEGLAAVRVRGIDPQTAESLFGPREPIKGVAVLVVGYEKEQTG